MGLFLSKAAMTVFLLGFAAAAAGQEAPASNGFAPPEYTERFGDAGADSARDDSRAGERNRIKEEMSRIGRTEVAGTRAWERRKSPRVAVLSSMALPGLGQLYNGRRLKTMIAAGTFTYYVGTAWFEQKKSQRYLAARDGFSPNTLDWRNQDMFYRFHKENAVTYLWWSGAAWLITALDAFVDAHLYDVRAVTPTVVRGGGDTKYLALSIGF
jgi:hypothetical protein